MIRRGARKKAPGANRYGLTPGTLRALTKYFASTFLRVMHCMRTSTGGFAPAGATKGLSARPLETFGPMLGESLARQGPEALLYDKACLFQQSAAPGANRYRLAPGALCIYLWLCREEPAPGQSGATSTVSSASTGRFMGREATPKAQRACLPCSPNASTSKSLRPLATCGCWVNSGVEAT